MANAPLLERKENGMLSRAKTRDDYWNLQIRKKANNELRVAMENRYNHEVCSPSPRPRLGMTPTSTVIYIIIFYYHHAHHAPVYVFYFRFSRFSGSKRKQRPRQGALEDAAQHWCHVGPANQLICPWMPRGACQWAALSLDATRVGANHSAPACQPITAAPDPLLRHLSQIGKGKKHPINNQAYNVRR